MFDAGSASDGKLQRSHGAARLRFDASGGRQRLLERYASAPVRILTPAREGAPEAVIANTSGGVAGGDSLCFSVAAGPGADGTVSGQAAEKIYRAIDRPARIDTRLDVGAGARLEWLPQETIMFNGARLDRDIRVDLAPDAELLLVESLALGRRAYGETFATGALMDRWRIDRAGRPIWRDALRLDGGDPAMAAAAGFADARAMATAIYCGPRTAEALEAARALPVACALGATVVRGLVFIRMLGDEAGALKHALGLLVGRLREAAFDRPPEPPRVWLC